jgi:hypothetical protein
MDSDADGTAAQCNQANRETLPTVVVIFDDEICRACGGHLGGMP